jgi:hypothetical protein
MTMTDAKQRNAVSEGIALGLLMWGSDHVELRDAVTWDRAIEAAWWKWKYRDRLLRVSTDIRQRRNGLQVATRGRERNRVYNLYWERDCGSWFVRRRPPWDEDPPDFEMMASDIPGGVPADGWMELAKESSRGIRKAAEVTSHRNESDE